MKNFQGLEPYGIRPARRANPSYSKDYINQAIISGADYEIGAGHGAVNHFHTLEILND